MSQSFNTCYIDTDGADVTQQFVEKEYLLDVYPNLINPAKAPALWVWGHNTNGSLADNSTANKSSPVQTVSGGTNWKEVSIGTNTFGSAGIKTDGTLWLWGSGSSGTHGNNAAIVPRSSPIQTISGGTNWAKISHGGTTVGAIKTDGSLWLWGGGANGVLGNNNVINQSSPVQTISAGTNWKQVAFGYGGSTSLAAAIKTDNSLWLWGNSNNGILGNNNATVPQSSPVQTISAGTNWKQVTIGVTHVAATKTDGSLWLWGSNGSGSLGNNSTTATSSPIQTISAGNNWKQVGASNSFTAAIKTDGTLWTWGCNITGQLGNNSTTSTSSPVQTVSGGTNWKQIATGAGTSMAAIKTDGTLWFWGCGRFGNFGNNSNVDQSSPVQTISGGTNWKKVSASSVSTGVIKEDGDW